MEKKEKFTERDPIITWETKSILNGEIHCSQCGLVQTYNELLDNGKCCECETDLTKELF